MPDSFFIFQTEHHGLRIDCHDRETSDHFEDYLTEEVGIEFSTSFEDQTMTFWLGRNYTREGAAKLIDHFLSHDGAT